MRIVYVDDLETGMEIAKSIYNKRGSILLRKGTVLTNKYIDKLKKINIVTIYIKDKLSEGIEIQNVIDDNTKIKAICNLKDQFSFLDNDKDSNKNLPKKNYKAVKENIKEILNNLKKSEHALMNLTELMSSDLYTYEHSINVTVLSLLIGTELGYDEDKLLKVGIGAMLHDIGKLKIDKKIIHKPGKLTDKEYEIVKKHAVYGYKLLKEDRFISPFVKSIVLLHHEKLDGSGYPKGLTKKEFENLEFVMIVAASDILDALINNRSYKDKMPIYKGVELLSSMVPEKIDPKIFSILKKKIAPFPEGTGVLLSNNKKGIVEKNNSDKPTRPIVRILNDQNEVIGKVDLMKDLTLFIEDS
ncbi:MAG: HD-GYP domain-containing protein, partial [Bacillota bacterium]